MSKEVHRIYFCKDGAILDTQIREGEDVTDTLNRCFKKISDLEAKLAEKDVELELARNTSINTNKMDIIHLQAENLELKQQLAEKEKEITQRLVIQEKDYNQDKISFAVEQLDKVKETTECVLDNALKNSSLNQSYYDRLLDEIDSQIKQLKEQ